MNTVLYGKGALGTATYEYLSDASDVNVVAICVDSVPIGNDRELVFAESIPCADGIPVINKEELRVLYEQGLAGSVILATDNELLDHCVKHLFALGVRDIAIVPSYYTPGSLSDESFIWIETDKPRMPYLEYHISFHCNLKCAGCTHFSNIVTKERFGNLDRFCDDLIRLRDLFWGIGKIRLMGGEPLLNPELPGFIYSAREIFPDSDIRVVSNGLLLREDHKAVLEAMRETSVYFDVSMYPPTVSCINRIADICNSHGVKLTVTENVDEFRANMNLHGKTDPAEAYNSCPASHCAYLCEGQISVCALPQLIDIYNERFGLDISPGEADIIDLYDEKLDGHDLLNRLKTPMDICRYCDVDRRSYKWFVSVDPAEEEWLAYI